MDQAMLASVPRRFLALLLDMMFVAVPGLIAETILPAVGSMIVTFLYFTVFESSVIRGTPGKYLLGIQVSDLSGARIAYRTAVIRYFMRIVSGILFFIGYVLAFFTEKKQTLHDLVAETLVIYGRNEGSLLDAWWEQMKSLVATPTPGAGGTATRGAGKSAEDRLSELERLQGLRERGALTEEEFQEQKRKILH